MWGIEEKLNNQPFPTSKKTEKKVKKNIDINKKSRFSNLCMEAAIEKKNV